MRRNAESQPSAVHNVRTAVFIVKKSILVENCFWLGHITCVWNFILGSYHTITRGISQRRWRDETHIINIRLCILQMDCLLIFFCQKGMWMSKAIYFLAKKKWSNKNITLKMRCGRSSRNQPTPTTMMNDKNCDDEERRQRRTTTAATYGAIGWCVQSTIIIYIFC